MKKVKVLIVDDTVLYRKILQDTLENFKEVEIVGSAPNGKIALSKIQRLKPDLMTLDIEMPELNGLETLKELKLMEGAPSTLMVSAFTTKDAAVTMEALNLGAFDFISKPNGRDIKVNVNELKTQFEPILSAFLAKQGITFSGSKQLISTDTSEAEPLSGNVKIGAGLKPQIVVIGVSTGGPKALGEVIPKIDANLGVPIVIVQHMPPLFTKALADSLNAKSSLTVMEGAEGMVLSANHVYIAPGGKQMRVEKNGGGYFLKVNDDPPENFCKPAVDYLFRSVAKTHGGKTLGIIMTGMGRDGVVGARLLKRQGAGIIAQNQQTCTVFGMPAEAIKADTVDYIAPLQEIATEINRIVKGF